jgi:cellobiose-specific phosphotransferase system component IIA
MTDEFDAKLDEINAKIKSREDGIELAHQWTLQIITQVLAGKKIGEVDF